MKYDLHRIATIRFFTEPTGRRQSFHGKWSRLTILSILPLIFIPFLQAEQGPPELWNKIRSSVAEVHIQKQVTDSKNPDSLRQILLNGALVDARVVPTIIKSFQSQAVGTQTPGYAIAYVGLAWNWLFQDLKDRQVTIEIIRPDGRIFPASLAGMDQRTGIVVIKASTSDSLSPAVWAKNPDTQASLECFPVDMRGREQLGSKLVLKKSKSALGNEYLTPRSARLYQGQLLFTAEGEFWGFITGTQQSIDNQVMLHAYTIEPNLKAIKDIISTGKDVPAGWVGVFLDEMTNQDGGNRIVITRIEPNSPAMEAGLLPGDQLREVNNQPLLNVQDFISRIRWSQPGSRLQFRVDRNKKTTELPIVISERKASLSTDRPMYYLEVSPRESGSGAASVKLAEISPPQLPMDIRPMQRRRPVLGFVGDDLTPQLGDFFGVQGGRGVLINTVFPGSLAEKHGMKAGDVILSLNNVEIVNQLGLAMELDAQGNVPLWHFRLMRERKPIEIKIGRQPSKPEQPE